MNDGPQYLIDTPAPRRLTQTDAGIWSFIAVHDPSGLRRWQRDCVDALLATHQTRLLATAVAGPVSPVRRQSRWSALYQRTVTAGLRTLDVVAYPAGADAVPQVALGEGAPLPDVDFILDFTTNGLAGDPAQPPLGIWRLHLGNTAPGELPCSREVAVRSPVITTAMVATVGGVPRTLHSATIKMRRSHRATLAAVLDAAVDVCRGAFHRAVDPQTPTPMPAAAVAREWPAVGPTRILAGQTRRLLRRMTDIALFTDIWAIGVIPEPASALIGQGALPEPAWKPMPGGGEFHADPFPVRCGETDYVLFEKFDPVQKRGVIAAARMGWSSPGGEAAETVVLDLKCHMSYPAVFNYDGHTYCAPEAHVLGGLRLFRMGAGPTDWTQVAHILPGEALIDATLVQHDGLWWLFATMAGDASDTDLHVWFAPSPFGPWTPHRLNPVKSDVTSSRPAGNFFRLNGRLYRPSQDCATGYGSAVVVHEVLQLDPGRFAEVRVNTLTAQPGWRFPHGLHTVNALDNLVVIDAKRRMLRWPALFAAFRRNPARAGAGAGASARPPAAAGTG